MLLSILYFPFNVNRRVPFHVALQVHLLTLGHRDLLAFGSKMSWHCIDDKWCVCVCVRVQKNRNWKLFKIRISAGRWKGRQNQIRYHWLSRKSLCWHPCRCYSSLRIENVLVPPSWFSWSAASHSRPAIRSARRGSLCIRRVRCQLLFLLRESH